MKLNKFNEFLKENMLKKEWKTEIKRRKHLIKKHYYYETVSSIVIEFNNNKLDIEYNHTKDSFLVCIEEYRLPYFDEEGLIKHLNGDYELLNKLRKQTREEEKEEIARNAFERLDYYEQAEILTKLDIYKIDFEDYIKEEMKAY